MRDIFRAVIASFAKSFKDTFNRADSSTLGTSSSGIPWTVYRNSFGISANKAVANSSDYSLAAVGTASSNVQIGLKGISQGAGASLWVTDSGNWWSVSISQQAENCNCTNYYNTFTYNVPYSYSYRVDVAGNYYETCLGGNTNYCSNGFNFNTYNPITIAYYCCYGWNANRNCAGNYPCSYSGGNGQYTYASYPTNYPCGFTCTYWQSGNNGYSYWVTVNGSNTETGYAGPYQSCQTCYPQYLNIFKSVNNVITSVLSQTVSGIVQSLGISTSGNQITVKTYSDTNMVTQIGSDVVYTATGATMPAKFGISVNPSSYNQGYSIDEVTID